VPAAIEAPTFRSQMQTKHEALGCGVDEVALVRRITGARHGDVVRIEGRGRANVVYAAGDLVVRLNASDDTAEDALRVYAKEVRCIALAASTGVPSPHVVAIGTLEGRAYMVQRRVQGIPGTDDVFPLLGRYARAFHAHPIGGFGDEPANWEGDGLPMWRSFVARNLDRIGASDPLIALDVDAPDESGFIRDVFERVAERPVRLGLAHGDLAPSNTLVSPEGLVLLDWGSAEVNVVPHYDLQAMPPAGGRPFLEGYGLDNPERVLRERAVALLKAFDLTRWAIDRCPPRISTIAARARARLDDVKELAGLYR
jgi:aminoglycoside phosphotransferase (APT) family kinase protein